MRTVTFADPAVIRELQAHFVLYWHDRLPAGVRPYSVGSARSACPGAWTGSTLTRRK